MSDLFSSWRSRTPLKKSATVSIASGGADTASLSVPSGSRWHLKDITLSMGGDVTVQANGVVIDGTATEETASFDVETVFGGLLTADRTVAVTGDNAGLTAQDLTIDIVGYSLDMAV